MIKSFNYLPVLDNIFEEVIEAVKKVLKSGSLILGPETDMFEQEFAGYVGGKHCIGVSSGTSALIVALMALNIKPGDEIITVSNTCVPTVSAIKSVGAVPVFVDINETDMMINVDLLEKSVTSKTKAIIPVHLWGQSADMENVMDFAAEHGLRVIEDCAQATGTLYNKKHVGNFGDIGCFSFYPTKNLGAYGDAGALITNNSESAEKIRKIRMYGYDDKNVSVINGTNARISEIQSGILRVKMKYLDVWLKRRRQIASYYSKTFINKNISLPFIHSDRLHSFHQFILRTKNRDKLANWLWQNGINYGIHYPVPVHKMPAYKTKKSGQELYLTELMAERIISIPVHESLSDAEINKIADVINRYTI